jgi:hypothetical protein
MYNRVTIAHQPSTNINCTGETSPVEDYSAGFLMCMKLDSEAQAVNDEQFNQLLANSTEWPSNVPVEDLTGEVQELMMRYTLQRVAPQIVCRY